MHLPSPETHPKITALAFALLSVALWLLLHGYHGLTGDAQIYAFQALARIHPHLATDLYLQNTSQDEFTIFSPFYSRVVGVVGLENAARLLTLLFTGWFLAAAWSFVRAMTDRDAAWLAVACLLIISGDYGGSGVFRISESYLTARLPAEALIATALACHVRGRRGLGLLLAVGGLFVHPLIALPGLLMLSCLWLPSRLSVAGAIAGVSATLVIAFMSAILPAGFQPLTVMDPAWLEVVRERSQFLFLTLWSARDWNVNVQPFFYLAFTAIAVPDSQMRRLCLAAGLVGIAGLAVALIGSLVGPIAILVQGQAWRWVWIAVFTSAALLPATALQVWRDAKCGPLCAILLLSGWTLPAVDGTACVSLSLLLWLARANINAHAARWLRWLCTALGIAIVVWIATKTWAILSPPIPPVVSTSSAGHPPATAAQLRDIFGLRVPAVLLCIFVLWSIRVSRATRVPTVVAAGLIALAAYIFPAAFKQSRILAGDTNNAEFSDWARAIPPTSTVLVAPAQDVGGFVWFTLSRPNYLAVDQSAGVVFSRATALEVKRRSDVLLPLMDPNWKILTSLRGDSRNRRAVHKTTRALTAEKLGQVCADLQLGFVVSPEDVGFSPLRHPQAGELKDWNLYDCQKIRSVLPAI